MADTYVRVQAKRWVADEPFPGLVEIELVDANGRAWTFVDKAPMFDALGKLSPNAAYPFDLDLVCTIIGRPDEKSTDRLLISTAKPWGLESVEGTSEFVVHPEQVINRDSP